MKSTFMLAALAALVAAAPHPQDIDFSMVLAAPNPTYSEAIGVSAQVVTYNAATILAAATATIADVSVVETDVAKRDAMLDVEKRAACDPQPAGATGAPTQTTDTAPAFASNTAFASIASAAPTPAGYSNTFTNLNASNNAMGYMGFTTLQTYDVQTCAAQCNKINGCMSVNICEHPQKGKP